MSELNAVRCCFCNAPIFGSELHTCNPRAIEIEASPAQPTAQPTAQCQSCAALAIALEQACDAIEEEHAQGAAEWRMVLVRYQDTVGDSCDGNAPCAIEDCRWPDCGAVVAGKRAALHGRRVCANCGTAWNGLVPLPDHCPFCHLSVEE